VDHRRPEEGRRPGKPRAGCVEFQRPQLETPDFNVLVIRALLQSPSVTAGFEEVDECLESMEDGGYGGYGGSKDGLRIHSNSAKNAVLLSVAGSPLSGPELRAGALNAGLRSTARTQIRPKPGRYSQMMLGIHYLHYLHCLPKLHLIGRNDRRIALTTMAALNSTV
jgi:hypothetical protein